MVWIFSFAGGGGGGGGGGVVVCFVLGLFSLCWGDHSLTRYSIYLSSIVSITSSYLPIYVYLFIYLSIYLPNLTIPSFRNTQSPPNFLPPFLHARTHAWFRRFLK